jgi:BirA family transcriptional regulator, biotin operon repressor / biotin---[acetyl-CoA-carboxylase] ligase
MLDAADILARIPVAARPAALICRDQVDSTMDDARHLLREQPQLTRIAVSAEFQQAGRGRNGRSWQAQPGSALLCSYGLRGEPAGRPTLNWAAALAAAEAVERCSGCVVALKWPNDLLLIGEYGPAKVGGLLIETSWLGSRAAWSVIGCGINLSAAPPPAATRLPAVSLAAAARRPIARTALLAALLERLAAWLTVAEREPQRTAAAWRRRLWTLGRRVTLDDGTVQLDGIAEDVDSDGRLLLRTADGALRAWSAADVSLNQS